MKIYTETIRALATNEATYQRGVVYFENDYVENVRWHEHRKVFTAEVLGNQVYEVTVYDSEEKCKNVCNCEAYYTYSGACKHIVAALLYIEKNYKQVRKEEFDIRKSGEKLISQFKESKIRKNIVEKLKLQPTIHFAKPILETNFAKVYLFLKIIQDETEYNVGNLKKFLEAVSQNKSYKITRKLEYKPEITQFDEDSRNILHYLLNVYDVYNNVSKSYNSDLFYRNKLSVTKSMLLRFLDLIEGIPFSLEIKEYTYKNVTYKKENPNIKYKLELNDEEIKIHYLEKYSARKLTDTGELILWDNVIYRLSPEFRNDFMLLYTNQNDGENEIIITQNERNIFLQEVLPFIQKNIYFEIPEALEDIYIKEDLEIKIYLDKYKNGISIRLIFEYGTIAINPLIKENKKLNNKIIVRNALKEEEILSYLKKLEFIVTDDLYTLQSDMAIYEFITENITTLAKQCTIYYSDDFYKIKVNKPGKFRTGIKLGNQMDYLEMKFEYDNIPANELVETFKSFKLKKKYHRLKDGTYIHLDKNSMEEIFNMFEYLDVSNKEISNSTVLLPISQGIYLNNTLKSKSNIVLSKAQEFDNMINKILLSVHHVYEVPSGINAVLRNYQTIGYQWFKNLSDYSLGGVLADDMGLGKTLQAIVYMLSEKEKGKSLVVCPTSLIYNWIDEIHKFAEEIKVMAIVGNSIDRQEVIKDMDGADVVITTYALLRRDIEYYNNITFNICIIDEAQFIKNPDSLISKAVKSVMARVKFALTGTPIENSLTELWSIFDFVMPGYLLSHNKFVNRYEKPIIRDKSQAALKSIQEHIKPFMLRRMKRDVLFELPDKIETKMTTELLKEQKQIYTSYVATIKEEINHEIMQSGLENSRIKILAALTRLRQICSHPATFIEGYKGGSGKLELLKDILPDIIKNGHRILIFSQFTSMLDIISNTLEEENIEYFYLQGSTKSKKRMDFVTQFNKGEKSVFLISLKAGGTGLNLIGADTVIHYDLWWNPAVEEQATDRAYRIGQKKSVQVIKMITKGTIEEKIYKLQMKKKDLADQIIESGEVFLNKLTREDIEDLFADL